MQVAECAVAHGTKSAVMASANKTKHKLVALGHEVMDDMAGPSEGGSCQSASSEGSLSDSGIVEGGPRGKGGGRGAVWKPSASMTPGPSDDDPGPSEYDPSKRDSVRVAPSRVTPSFNYLLKHLKLTFFCT